MIIDKIKDKLQLELAQAKDVWIASAMITSNGWNFIQKHIPKSANQNFLIGIDLATSPIVFENILANPQISAKVYQSDFTFHPKVYLIEKADNSYTAFIGSSNTTTWGLEKNVEMNFQTSDQNECKKILDWFNMLFMNGYFIDDKFLKEYKVRFKKAKAINDKLNKQIGKLKLSFSNDNVQFFTKEDHELFNKKYHSLEDETLKAARFKIREKFLKLHRVIYPQFNAYGLEDLHSHHQASETVSRYFFNQFSGKYIDAMWLHYGKSKVQLQKYANADKSINKPHSFINNIRMQIIIREDHLGIWLVLGRNNGSIHDRKYFRQQMQSKVFLKNFYDLLKKLGSEYWLSVKVPITVTDFKNPEHLLQETLKESHDEYFIIGRSINWLDQRISEKNIADTVLGEFRKLYPIYEMMKHR